MEDPAFETLASERLVIRRFASDDVEAFAAYRSEPEVARYQDWECPYSASEAAKLVAGQQSLAPGTPGTWFQFAVGLAPSDTLIGDVALRTRRSDARQGEIGFTFSATHQRHGYATEAVRAVVQYAFVRLAMHRLLARTDARNLRAQRLLERLAFRREGELGERTWFKGEWATELLYVRLESEWRRESL